MARLYIIDDNFTIRIIRKGPRVCRWAVLFNATTTDYASRFKLIFDPHYGVGEDGPSADSEAFAYYANGEIVINDVETCHGASLQIMDMTGRVIMKRDATNRVSTSGLAKGVYLLRLDMTNGIRTQKIVIQ